MKYLFLLIFLVILVFPLFVHAIDPALDRLQAVGSDSGSGPYHNAAGEFGLVGIIGMVIQAALSLIGAIFLALMLYAGYHWMTSRGEEEKVEKAKDTIVRAIIGIIIVVGSYAIWAFIFTQFIQK